MGWRWVWSFGVLFGTVWFVPRSANACSILTPPPELDGYPSEGATDVPTDVIPFYNTWSLQLPDTLPSSVRFESSDGDIVEATAQKTHEDAISLFPETALEPLTSYTLTVVKPSVPSSGIVAQGLSLEFTTGAGPVELTPEPPAAWLQHYRFGEQSFTSCSPQRAGTCVALDLELPVQAEYIDEIGQALWTHLIRGPWFTNLSGIDQGANIAFVRLRLRAANGTYSEPVNLSGEGVPLVTLHGSENIACTPAGITQDDVLVGTQVDDTQVDDPDATVGGNSAACSFAAPRNESRSAGLVALGLLALTARFQRRRRHLRR
ncbi:MAG TPA: hypothetical protein VJN18_05705 [Polyangiaceae bacterium]|nr:hypothetical protein [Polyangiaceae bacterium]